MTKNVIICFLVLVSTLGYSQSKIETKNLKIETLIVEVSIDTSEEFESLLKTKDLENLFKTTENNEDITFTLNCNFKEEKDK